MKKVLSICWKEGVRGFFVGNSTAYNILSTFDVIITFVLLQFREGVHVLEFYL
ncbi:transmembrane protein, putative [Medicago truncatula]|nr:transmembrane protein, putative [Medicago truncatula]